MTSRSKPYGTTVRKWFRWIHRDLSFFFAGVIVIYAISGLALNHKRDFDSDYSVTRTELQMKGAFPHPEPVSLDEVMEYLDAIGEQQAYMKHYYFGPGQLKVFLKGGSSLVVDMNTGKAVYELVKKRVVLGSFIRLHYNPGKWWTWFSDLFAISLLVITLTGLFMNKGRTGLWGRGGIEMAVGILLPLLLLLLN